MTTKQFTREERITMARRATAEVAAMKDWRITNFNNRRQREAARCLMRGHGYLEMTQATAHDVEPRIEEYVSVVKYDGHGNAYTERERADKEQKIWGYTWNSCYKVIQLTAV